MTGFANGFDEAGWWGDCANTHHEEGKQFVYAKYMGLKADWSIGHCPVFDVRARDIVDIGGGPVSLLLKCVNRRRSVVIDPSVYPDWIAQRYRHCGIDYFRLRGEDFEGMDYDEAWCYNVLQHVDDPERIAANMRRAARYLRVFEWINLPAYPGHPHALTEKDMNRWFGRAGHVNVIAEDGAIGEAWSLG